MIQFSGSLPPSVEDIRLLYLRGNAFLRFFLLGVGIFLIGLMLIPRLMNRVPDPSSDRLLLALACFCFLAAAVLHRVWWRWWLAMARPSSAVVLALLFLAAAPSAAYSGKTMESCMKETTLKIGKRELVITLREAEQIKLTVERYLAEEKPELEPSVSGPGAPFIDCQGTVRMGGWILESSHSVEPELHLAFSIVRSDLSRVRQEIELRHWRGHWKVTGIDRVTYHRGFE